MFATTILPPLVSLLSSTGSKPLQLFSQHTDISHPNDSFIQLLIDDSSSRAPLPTHSHSLVTSLPGPSPSESRPDGVESTGTDLETGGDSGKRRLLCLCQTVLHIQSPMLRTTFIRCPPLEASSPSPSSRSWPAAALDLGLSLPCMHVQVRTLGRDWAFECGIVDKAGRSGVVRFSTFQKEAKLVPTHDPPLLHVPLRFPHLDPSSYAYALTSWSTIDVDFRAFVSQFQAIGAPSPNPSRDRDRHAYLDLPASESEPPGGLSVSPSVTNRNRNRNRDDKETTTTRKRFRDAGADADGSARGTETPSASTPLPSGAFDHVSYVKVYATCRLRRIWFTDGRPGQRMKMPWEFELYGS